MSPLSPELVVRPTREGGATQPEGILLPTMLDDFNDSVLGDPISYARIDQLPGSESLSLPVYAWPPKPAFMMDSVIQTVLAPQKSERLPAESSFTDPPCHGGKKPGWSLGCPYRFLEFGELPFTDGNPAYGLQLHHPRFLELVGAPESARLLDCAPSFWKSWVSRGNGGCRNFATGRRCYVVESTDTIPVCYGIEQDVIFNYGLGPQTIVVSGAEVDALAPALRSHRAAPYMSAMGLWRPQRSPTVPGPVPASSCNSCMNCKYCFPEDQLPPM